MEWHYYTGDIFFLNDSAISEILINQPKEIWAEKGGELIAYDIPKFKEINVHAQIFVTITINHYLLKFDKEPNCVDLFVINCWKKCLRSKKI